MLKTVIIRDEDNVLGRNFNDCYKIPELLKAAYEAGKNAGYKNRRVGDGSLFFLKFSFDKTGSLGYILVSKTEPANEDYPNEKIRRCY